jgi:hypothetical protein
MKRFQSILNFKIHQLISTKSRKWAIPVILILFSGFHALAQTTSLPVVKVRFANPYFECQTQKYCVDVEFMSAVPDLQLYGMNVRFYYDDSILEYLSMGDFAEGYASLYPPQITTDDPACGDLFGFTGPLEWFNGSVQLTSSSPVTISTSGWTKLFNICFHVDGPYELGVTDFCPSLVWDLQSNTPDGGFQHGDDGVVMTIADPTGLRDSAPTAEQVVQFNWAYEASGNPYGYPQSTVCITKICGYLVPLSDWAIYLAIGLMLITTLFIWKRRMNS